MSSAYRSHVERIAPRHQLAPFLVLAVCSVESSGHRYAWNPEPRYRYLWDVTHKRPFRALSPDEITSARPPADFPMLAGDRDQEWWGQRASWGLMQIMGATARELGFQEPYLTQLTDPAYAIEFGCSYLAWCVRRMKGDIPLALGAYNAGPLYAGDVTGMGYAARVLHRQAEIEALP